MSDTTIGEPPDTAAAPDTMSGREVTVRYFGYGWWGPRFRRGRYFYHRRFFDDDCGFYHRY